MTNNFLSLNPVAITAYSTLNACGLGNQALLHALQNNQSFLTPLTLFDLNFPTVVGEIKSELAQIRPELADYQSRNAQVALTALNYQPDGLRVAIETAKARYGSKRIGVIIGTSTSGLYETESAYGYLLEHGEMPDDFHFVTRHAYQATGRFLQLELGLSGACFAISTACSSGAKAIAAGQRLINSDVCDAVLVGGVDTLCRLTLRGFSSLELVSPNPCTPMDKNRTGISIGEAAGLLLLEKSTPENQSCPQLLAVGESSDAHHMSHPHPEGLGAALAMQQALDFAGLTANQIDYLNLHATATKINDAVESRAVYSVFKNQLPCSGTKGITGHTLGAAGAVETIIALLALQQQLIPATTGVIETDEDCLCQIVEKPRFNQNIQLAMSNSFGFGGNNASVIVAKSGVDLPSFKNPASLNPTKSVFIKSAVVCCPDAELLKQFDLESIEIDKNLIPAAMRRRTSLTTRMAITAATHACIAAQVDTGILPSVFASLGGEIQVTDALCRLLPNPDELLSPTQFHNSVHNTTAGYWGILNHCQAATTAIAAVDDGFAMGLLEAWSQLQQTSGDILLVCYDEEWPQYLAAPIGKVAFACALVLSTDENAKIPKIAVPTIGIPNQSLDAAWTELVKAAPAAAAIPLLQGLKNQRNGLIPLNIHPALWQVFLQV